MGWPLLTVETGVNGESKSTNERGWLVRWACRAITRDLCSALASLVSQIQNIFFPHFYISPSPSNLGRQPVWFTGVLVYVSDFNSSEIFFKVTIGAACLGL